MPKNFVFNLGRKITGPGTEKVTTETPLIMKGYVQRRINGGTGRVETSITISMPELIKFFQESDDAANLTHISVLTDEIANELVIRLGGGV